ncbi:MAG TPA: hypothetical protein VMH00_11005 [Candidatus Limnocylindrales bacterium]|nr:hypothetical protein [Candidatus Limnocylindrales bacterium]
MRRAQAIVALIMLASLPLILLGDPAAPPACNGMCCVRHAGSHEMQCHRGAAGHMLHCGMKPHSQVQPAVLAPLPPTMLSGALAVPAPVCVRRAVVRDSQSAPPGFLSVPFEPPRA